MSLRLILARHAKSSWDDPALDDHDRPLNERGQRAAGVIGNWLAQKGYQPDVVLSSTALRAIETWTEIAPYLDGSAGVEFSSALYHASPQAMLAALAPRHESVVMLIGHNPGIAALAAGLIMERPKHAQFGRYPTGATSVIDFELTDWRAVGLNAGRISDFVVPRDIV